MAGEWLDQTWGDLATLEYGKALRGYEKSGGRYLVFGTNGPIGWHDVALFNGPSVVVGRKGAYRGVHFASNPFFVIDTAFYLKPRVAFDVRWAYYELLTHDINGMDSGSAIPSTSRDAFYALPVRVPPRDEQRAIAHILGTLDDKIELNRRMNETLEAIARAIFKSWFVDFDPVRAKASGEPPASICRRLGLTPDLLALFPDRLVDSELGEIPEGWEVKPLDEIANYLNGLALQKYPPEAASEWLPVIKIAQLKSRSTVGADRASHRLDPDYVVDDGDVLFSWSGSLEVDVWCGGRGALNQHLFKVTSKTHPKWFFFYWTREHLAQFRTIAASKAVTMGHIQRKHLTEALCAVPRGALLERADGLIAPMLQHQIENRRQSRTLSATRDALLPTLLSGELRVEGAERSVEVTA